MHTMLTILAMLTYLNKIYVRSYLDYATVMCTPHNIYK